MTELEGKDLLHGQGDKFVCGHRLGQRRGKWVGDGLLFKPVQVYHTDAKTPAPLRTWDAHACPKCWFCLTIKIVGGIPSGAGFFSINRPNLKTSTPFPRWRPFISYGTFSGPEFQVAAIFHQLLSQSSSVCHDQWMMEWHRHRQPQQQQQQHKNKNKNKNNTNNFRTANSNCRLQAFRSFQLAPATGLLITWPKSSEPTFSYTVRKKV